MSAPASPVPAAPVADQMLSADGSNHPRKSYRRKYRKIMVKFEERMRESNGLFKDEQRIFDISQRLAEQTDQLLEMLVELNGRPQIPSRFRYDLRPSGDSGLRTSSKPLQHQEEQAAHENLRAVRNRVQKGEVTPFEYESVQTGILESSEFAARKSYATLIGSIALDASSLPLSEASVPPTMGILTTKQEEQYLQSLDDYLDRKTTVPRTHATKTLGSRSTEKTADREREMQLKNPVSVYNWLRKHQPQVFLQDQESSNGDKTGKSAGSRSSKRNAGKEIKQEPDYYDEDGIAVDQTGSQRGKRKREEDTAFRPKGGRPGHPSKRRKEDSSGKRSKRSSMDARNG